MTAATAISTDLTLRDRLNGPWHRPALRIFSVIVLAHLAEHIVQAWQVYVLGYPLMEARGILGQWFPWLVHSEVMHFGYALIMLSGLWLFLPGFVGRGRKWWLAALVIQCWHFVEHLLLQAQVIVGHNLLGKPVPTSIIQLWIPRLELHLFYNTIVFIPMVVAMYYHLLPPAADRARARCSCALHAGAATA
jgi:hypothetical protein